LKSKIDEVIRRMMAKKGFEEALGIIRQKKGYTIKKNLDQFKKQAENFISELQTQKPLIDFTKS